MSAAQETPAAAPPLGESYPMPADRPEADIVIFDGTCNFCRAQVDRLIWWDCCGHLAYLPLQDPLVGERWPEVSLERLHDEMCVVERPGSKNAGRLHWGPEAFRYLTYRLRRLWWLMPVMYFPGMMLLARPVYRLVSRNRHLIAGKNKDCESGTCSLPR